jgi:DNA mismatch endonuclease (patch repair protein)
MPTTRPEFWKAKLEANVARDSRAVAKLREQGWRVLSVWECATRDADELSRLQDDLAAWIEGDAMLGEIGAPPRV